MEVRNKATRIDLFSLKTRQMRAFHMSWFAFYLCFFAWFGIAPLLGVVGEGEGWKLTNDQLYNSMIASVAITIFARLFIGWLCDRIGPRLSYTLLLIFGSLPVMGIGLSHSYETFLIFRLCIGVIGASFVITQYHTSVMFAPNCVGTANATSAGWGNLGGGVTQMVMPLLFTGFLFFNFSVPSAWRLSMLVAGGVCFLTGIAYYFFTTDLPDGNFKELRASGELGAASKNEGAFWLAARDYRVWALFLIYAACFGIELTINGMAARYYANEFGLGIKTAGLAAGLFGLMNIFARTLGGFISDRFVRKGGLKGRVLWLFIALLAEGFALVFFSQMRVLALAIPAMIVFSLFVQMSEGATYSIVPFVNKKALGPVAGIVGAGGNMGAVAAGVLFRFGGMDAPTTLLVLGGLVTAIAFITYFVRFSPADEKAAADEFDKAMARRREELKDRVPIHDLIPGIRHLRPMDALRIYLGIALMIKGIYFIMNMAALEEKVPSSTMPLGTEYDLAQIMITWTVVFAHVIGGACLALGFITRIAAAANALILLGAVIIAITGGNDVTTPASQVATESVVAVTDAGGEPVQVPESGAEDDPEATDADGAWEELVGRNIDFQFSAFVFFILVLFIWRGSGPLSLDHLIRIDAEKEPEIL